jgi:hypothetical protein
MENEDDNLPLPEANATYEKLAKTNSLISHNTLLATPVL